MVCFTQQLHSQLSLGPPTTLGQLGRQVKDKDSLQVRLAELNAQLSQTRSNHSLLEVAAADAKVAVVAGVGKDEHG